MDPNQPVGHILTARRSLRELVNVVMKELLLIYILEAIIVAIQAPNYRIDC